MTGVQTCALPISGRRSTPYSASLVADYQVPFVRGLRIGVNGTLTPDYHIAIFDGVIYKGGKAAPLSGYVMYDRRVLNRQMSFRLGLQNMYDVLNGDSRYRITGATSFNTAAGRPNYIYRYAEPTTVNFSVNTRL